MPEVEPRVRPHVDPRVVDDKAFDRMHPDPEARARAKSWFKASIEAMNKVSGMSGAKADELVREATRGIFDKVFEERGIKEVDRLTEGELFPEGETNIAKFNELIEDPSKAPSGKQAAYQALKDVIEDTGRTGKGVLEMMQREVGTTTDVEKMADRFEKGGATKWDALMLAMKLAAVAGAITAGVFALKAYQESITGCFRTDNGTDHPPLNISRLSGCMGNAKAMEGKCGCDYNQYDDVGHRQLLDLCSMAPVCWDSKDDVNNALKQRHDYHFEKPDPAQSLVKLADTLMDGLSNLLKKLMGPLVKILIFVGIGVAVLAVIVLLWKLLPKLLARHHKQSPTLVLLAPPKKT